MKQTAVLALCAATAALAQPIPIVNPGFESDPAPPNFWTIRVPFGWTLHDPMGIVDQNRDAVGCLNPTNSTYFPAGAPQGVHVALLYLEGDRGGGEVGLVQQLPRTVAPDTRYTLRVAVGNIASGIAAPPFNFFFDLDGFPGYSMQILAGGLVVAELRDPVGASIPEGEFRERELVFDAPASHPRIGQPISIRLINLNIAGTPDAPGIEVDFDNVRLDASPLCPADFDNSGGVDGDDVIAFFGAWDGGLPAADVNGDSGVDGDDVIAFFERWDAGC
ncbi:MAG: GC-type dockerin domain-anchored protein [Phycisphaerales bacterium]